MIFGIKGSGVVAIGLLPHPDSNNKIIDENKIKLIRMRASLYVMSGILTRDLNYSFFVGVKNIC